MILTTQSYVKEKWDYLLILDACRYDVFKEIVEEKKLKGKLHKFNTRVNQTPFWYRRYWSYKDNDIHLITANPQPFTAAGGWNAYRRFKTARWTDPESANEKEFIEKWQAADYEIWEPNILLDVFEKYKKSNERYLLHFIPPHLPYIGTQGKRLLKKLGVKATPHRNVYNVIRDYGQQGNWQEVRAYYKESLVETLNCIIDRIDLFSGKIVISSDHAEIIGEPNFDKEGKYGHGKDAPARSDLWELVCTVPWFEMEV